MNEVPRTRKPADVTTNITSIDPQQSGSAAALVEVLDKFLADLRDGNAPDRDAFLAQHPDLAPQLADCLDGLDFIHRASNSDDQTPAQLGDFRIVREIGCGGMGVVYEAEQLSLKRRVALKVLRFGGVADKEAVERFQREAETVAGLEHPHIVPVHAVGCEGGAHFFAMQLIEGESLADRFGDGGEPLDPKTIAHWGQQAAIALAHAHQRGVIHRDVKPSNLILDGEGQLWLTDFGLASREIDASLSLAGALLGTPRYMSPEQADLAQRNIDHRTDIYSLGATLYELATGTPVFDGETPLAVISSILTTDPAPPRKLNAKLPLDLETIILKCLSRAPFDRYTTSQELSEDFNAFLDGRPIRARRASRLERLTRFTIRRKRQLTRSAVVAMLAIFIALLSVWGLELYQNLRKVEVAFLCDLPGAAAEVLDDDNQRIAGPIYLPTPTGFALPPGDWRVRVSRYDNFSQTWPITLKYGQKAFRRFNLSPKNSWTVSDFAWNGRRIKFLSTPAKTDVIDLFNEEDRQRLQRLDGATGEPLWSTPFSFPEKYFLRDRSNLVEPAPDLDADGYSDLIWGGLERFLVQSGADGSILWAKDHLGEDLDRFDFEFRLGKVSPLFVDVDEDDVLDFIFPLTDQTVQATSGSTGDVLWQTEDFAALWDSETRIELVKSDGKDAIHVTAGAGIRGEIARQSILIRPATNHVALPHSRLSQHC